MNAGLTTDRAVSIAVNDALVRRPSNGYRYDAILYHEVFNLLHWIETLDPQALRTIGEQDLRRAMSVVDSGCEPEGLSTALARYIEGDARYQHCGDSGPYGAGDASRDTWICDMDTYCRCACRDAPMRGRRRTREDTQKDTGGSPGEIAGSKRGRPAFGTPSHAAAHHNGESEIDDGGTHAQTSAEAHRQHSPRRPHHQADLGTHA